MGDGRRIAVIGAGSWGTALAILLARNGCDVRLWGRNQEKMENMAASRCNERYLPGITLPDRLQPTADLDAALDDIDELLLVVPSQGFRATLQKINGHLAAGTGVAFATKGMEPKTFKLMHTLVTEELAVANPAVISGPTFAAEVAMGLPTAVTVACHDNAHAQRWADYLSGENFRAYTSEDVTGVELGGAVKNVLAIGAGIADGLNLGANTRAALITRGLHEVQRLGVAMGGDKETFMGLAGLGDLVLTCTDNQSRNRRVGLALAQGIALDEALEQLGQVAEGVYAAQEVHGLAEKNQVDMPICQEVYQVIYHGKDPLQAVHNLLSREIKPEQL